MGCCRVEQRQHGSVMSSRTLRVDAHSVTRKRRISSNTEALIGVEEVAEMPSTRAETRISLLLGAVGGRRGRQDREEARWYSLLSLRA